MDAHREPALRSRRRSRLTAAATLATACALLVACGGGSQPTTTGTTGSSSSRDLTAVDLESVQAAVDAARAAPTGRYVLVQSLRAAEGGQTQVIITRKGSYDRERRLHQVEASAPGRGGDEPILLTFLTTSDDALMRNPAFTAQHGRPWTRLPAADLAALGADPTTAAVEPPALDVAASAQAPGRVLKAASATEYEVLVPQAAAIELFANAGAFKLSQLTGLPPEELPAAFTGTLPATVTLSKDGALRSLSTDLRPLLQRATEVAAKPVEDFGDASLLVQVTWQPGAPVSIDVPDPVDIGDIGAE